MIRRKSSHNLLQTIRHLFTPVSLLCPPYLVDECGEGEREVSAGVLQEDRPLGAGRSTLGTHSARQLHVDEPAQGSRAALRSTRGGNAGAQGTPSDQG